MKKLLLIGLLVLITGVFIVGTANAQQDPLNPVCTGGGAGSSICVGAQKKDPLFGADGILTKVIQILVMIGGVASVIMVMVGGFKYITSTGEPAKVSSAKDTILYALIGLVVTVSAQVIVVFVLKKL